MFFKKENKPSENLLQQVTQKFESQIQKLQNELDILKEHLTLHLQKKEVSPASVMTSLRYHEIPSEKAVDFIFKNPEMLILDIRGDLGWSQGHIPEAKHIPSDQVYQRMDELPPKDVPILIVCSNGNASISIASMLSKDYHYVYLLQAGMAGYKGVLSKAELELSDVQSIQGKNRKLIEEIASFVDAEIRPRLKNDGGDMTILAFEDSILKVKMTGACQGCGAKERTIEKGIKQKLIEKFSDIQDVSDS